MDRNKYKSSVPAGAKGVWKVEKYTVSESAAQLDALRSAIHGSGRFVPPGEYTKLSRNGEVIMSDTPDECHDFWQFEHKATGVVLINGLGLGVCAQAVLRKPEVQSVTVIELSQDVIDLVAPHIADSRLTVICASAYDWQPPKGVRYNAVWHDIWDNLCTDNLVEMARLHRKYARRCDWQGSWGKEILRYRKRQEDREMESLRYFRTMAGLRREA